MAWIIVTIVGILGTFAVIGYGYFKRTQADKSAPRAVRPAQAAKQEPIFTEDPGHPTAESTSRISHGLSRRLWVLAFGAPEQPVEDAAALSRARAAVEAALRTNLANHRYLPRRPLLMPQLQRAINDPRGSREKVARIIGQDPVLSADVLRLSNSVFYRLTDKPVESIQRAVVICGTDGLHALLTSAMLQPIFRATEKNFAQFPAVLWERSERASRVAELYAGEIRRGQRFEAQLLALFSALGPLMVYRILMEYYAKNPALVADPGICATLINEFGPRAAHRVAAEWKASPSLAAALEPGAEGELPTALQVGELVASLSLLQDRKLMSETACEEHAGAAGVHLDMFDQLTRRLQQVLVQPNLTASRPALRLVRTGAKTAAPLIKRSPSVARRTSTALGG